MSGNTAVNNVNIKFSDLRTKRGNESFTGGTVLGSNNISLSEFRGTKFKDNSVVPESGSISINTHFKDKTFSREHTTDSFRAFDTWSSYSSKLKGTGSSSDSFWSGSNTSNISIKLSSSNAGEPYSSLILVPGNQSEADTNKFMIVDRSDANAVDEAEVWFKVKSHSSYNSVQFGLLKKDHDITWKQEIDHAQMQNHHAGKADRISFHGAGFHTYAGSRDDIVSSNNVISPAWTDYASSLTTYSDVSSQGLTTNFHNIIGVTAGTQKSSINASRTDSSGAGKTAEFNRSRHFFTNWPSFTVYNYPGYRFNDSSNSIYPSHGLKIRWYEKTIDVYLTENSQYIIPQNGGSWTNDSDSSTGLTDIFSGMYILSVSPNSGIPVQDTEDSGSQYNVFIGKIHTNYMVMYQERGVSDLTTINATASGNVTLTLGGYLYWTLTTRNDTSSSNTNYKDQKIIGPPHTVLPRWQVDSIPTSSTISGFYQTKEWAFYIGDTTSNGTNYFEYVLRNTAPGGTAFNYSVTYSQGTEHNTPEASPGVYPNTNLYTSGHIISSGNKGTSLQSVTYDLSSSNYANSSVIGKTGHLLYNFSTTHSFAADIQLVSVNVNGTTSNIGGTGSGLGNYTNWRRSTGNNNQTYSSNGYSSLSTITNFGTSSTHTSNAYSHRWVRKSSGGTSSSGTGVNTSSSYIMFEASGGSGNYPLKGILVSPEVTFTSNSVTINFYANGTHIGNLRGGVEITDNV